MGQKQKIIKLSPSSLTSHLNMKELNNQNNFPFTKRRNTSYAVLIPHRSFSFDGILFFRLSVLFLFAAKG